MTPCRLVSDYQHFGRTYCINTGSTPWPLLHLPRRLQVSLERTSVGWTAYITVQCNYVTGNQNGSYIRHKPSSVPTATTHLRDPPPPLSHSSDDADSNLLSKTPCRRTYIYWRSDETCCPHLLGSQRMKRRWSSSLPNDVIQKYSYRRFGGANCLSFESVSSPRWRIRGTWRPR